MRCGSRVLVLSAALSGWAAVAPRAQETTGAPRVERPAVEVLNTYFPEGLARHLPEEGAWLPVYVEMRARGDRSVRVTLEATLKTPGSARGAEEIAHRMRFDVPPGDAPHRAWLYVWLDAGQDVRNTLDLRYSAAGRTLPLGSIGQNGRVLLDSDREEVVAVLFAGGERGETAPWGRDLSLSSDLRSPPHLSSDGVENVAFHQLPDSALGYDGFDCVVLRGLDERRLEPAQKDAVREWVALGGRVVFVPSGARESAFEGELFRELAGRALAERVEREERFVPADLYWIDRESMRRVPRGKPYATARAFTRVGPPRPFTRLDPLKASAETVREIRSSDPSAGSGPESLRGAGGADAPGKRLYAEVRYGSGFAGVLAVDDQTYPLRESLELRTAFWQKIAGSSSRRSSRWPGRPAARRVAPELREKLTGGSRELGTFVISGLVIAYVVAAGPALYLLLRWRRRLTAVIWAGPAVALLFVGAIFATGYVTKGFLTQARFLTVLHQLPGGGIVLRESYLSLFSAGDATYQLECPQADALGIVFANEQEVFPLVLEESAAPGVEAGSRRRWHLRDLYLALWQEAVVVQTAVERFDGRLALEELSVDGAPPDVVARFRVRNDLPYDVAGGWLGEALPGHATVPPIPSGGSVLVDVARETARSAPRAGAGTDLPGLDRLQAVSTQVQHAGRPLLWALIDRPQADFRLDRPFTSSERLDLYVVYER